MPLDAHRNDFPEVSTRLLRAIKKAGSERKFAELRGINIKYVSDLLSKGIEPTDRTEKGRAARRKLYLPKRKRVPRLTPPAHLPPHMRWWRSLGKGCRNEIIERLHTEAENGL